MNGSESRVALVLSGGGARAAYQVGVLAGIVDRSGGEARFPIVTGVSAGAINAAGMCGRAETLRDAVRRLQGIWLSMSVGKVFDPGPASLAFSLGKALWTVGFGGLAPRLQVRGLLNNRPLRRMLRRAIDADDIDANLRQGRLRALALSATSYSSGRTVTFVHGSDDLPMWRRSGRQSVRARIGARHVLASSALPLLFPAVEAEGEWFGDGSIRQTAPLAPAIHLGAERILAIAIRHRAPGESSASQLSGYPPAAQVLGMLFNAVFLDVFDADAERLERINRSLAAHAPDSPHPEGLRSVATEVLRPSKDLGELAAGLDRHLPGALRALMRGLGSGGLRSPDLASYLLFERPYIERLLDLGFADARANWDRIERLLDSSTSAAAPPP